MKISTELYIFPLNLRWIKTYQKKWCYFFRYEDIVEDKNPTSLKSQDFESDIVKEINMVSSVDLHYMILLVSFHVKINLELFQSKISKCFDNEISG